MFRDCRAALSHARGQPRRPRSPCSGRSAVPERFTKLLSSGSRRNQRKAAWGEEQTGHANPRALETSSASAFSYCATQRSLEPCGPFTRTTTRQLAWPFRDLRGGPSPLPLRGTLRDGDVCGGLVFAFFVVSGRFFVVPCCVFIMFCRFMMMLCCLL